MESSSLPSWKKWSKGITLKKALSRASLRQPKRRKIGVVAATATNPAEILESSKTAFTNNELLSADSSIKDNSLTESNFDQTKFYSNGDVVKDTLLTSDVSKSSPGGDSRTTNSHNSSPFTIKRNGFMTEPLQNSPNSKAEKKKRKFVNVVSKPTLDTEQSFSSSIHALKEEKSPKLKYNLRRRNTSEQFTHLGLLTPAFILHPSIHQVFKSYSVIFSSHQKRKSFKIKQNFTGITFRQICDVKSYNKIKNRYSRICLIRHH